MVKILTHNINGIRAILKKDNIIDNKTNKKNTYLNYIKKENPDIICFNELKICQEKYNKEFIKELLPEYQYKCFNLSCEKRGYSGVSIFSKIEPLSFCTKLEDNSTGRYTIMEFEKFILICVYVINSGEKLKNLDKRALWDKQFIKKIKQLQKDISKEIIITGDMNVINREIDTHDFKSQHNKLAGVSNIEIGGFQKLIRETKLIDAWLELKKPKVQYSYFTHRFNARQHNKGMRIDYFLMNKKLLKKIKNIEIDNNIYGSDHLPIILDIDL